MIRLGEHRLRVAGDVGERGGEIDVLERAAAEHLRRHLARDREHRRAVDLGVVETGEQVGRSRARDPEAGGGPAGELAVGAGRERRRALVADADEREVASFLLTAHGVGESEVGVTDHAEHVRDAPRDHRFDHHIGHGAHVRDVVGHVDVDAVVTQLDRELRRSVGEAGRGSARERVVVVPVPGTPQPALLDRTLPERAALVRAPVVERAVLVAHVGEHETAPSGNDGAYAPVGQVVELGDPVPGHPCPLSARRAGPLRPRSVASRDTRLAATPLTPASPRRTRCR